MKPKPLTTFRAYCEKETLYYKVIVWRTLGEFRKACPGNSNALALCRSYRILSVASAASGKRDYKKPILGEIHLAATRLTTGITSHEAAHAMLNWAAETKCIPLFNSAVEREATVRARNGRLCKDDPEERCCYVLGNLVRQIVFKLYQRKILK